MRMQFLAFDWITVIEKEQYFYMFCKSICILVWIIMFVMQCELVVLLMLWAVTAISVSGPSIQTNFNISSVNDYSLVSTPLQVPLSLLRNSDPIAHTPIIQKYYVNLFRNHTPGIDISHIKTRMLPVDHEMLFGQQPPATFFESKNIAEYHLLESMEFSIMLSNPSQLFTVCLIEVFSDCQSIKRAMKRPLPLCINPYTKYPLNFNIYVTAAKNREAIHSAIFFNATIKYDGHILTNRIWKKQVSFNLLPNHLKLYSFELRNCKQEHSVISIKNPQKHELSLLIVYKHKKLYMNNQPFDQKVLVAAGKTFRFMIEGRDATMTIYTSNPEQVNKKYPILYVPLYCQQYLSIEYIPLGILSAPNLALTYPILVTSHSSSQIQITEIDLHSSSQAVQLIKSPSHKIFVQPNDKFSQIGSFVVRASKNPAFKNTVSIRIICKSTNNQNSSQIIQITRTLTYTQLYNVVQVGNNRFYDVTQLKDGQYTQSEKIQLFNYTLTNKLQIPIRLERILFNSQKFRMHWFKFSRSYIYPNQHKEEILLQYIGPKNLPLSPLKYIAVIELSGGLFIPFETMVYDNTLTCVYQGKEDRCSKLKTISFGYQKSDLETQSQQITIKNQNPTNITLQLHPFALPKTKQLNFTVNFESPFPFYENSVKKHINKSVIQLRSGHTISMVIEVKVNKKVTGDISLLIQTPYQKFAPKLRFHFETGKLAFTPQLQQIQRCDLIHKGVLNLTSTFQDSFTIKEIISSSPKFQFIFNESHQYQPLQSAILPYVYNPYKQQNYTDECCGEDFVKNHFINSIINGEETVQENYEISVITSNDVEQKTAVKVKPFHKQLLSTSKQQSIQFKIMKVNSGGYFCLNVTNPYPQAMKYSIYFLSHIVVQKPKDYFTYLKHVKRQRTETYFCIKNQARNLKFITPASLKQLFRLQQKPTDLLLSKDGLFGDSKLERNNLSNNDYINSFTSYGNQICYKFTSVLYIKLLIESEVINDILENYPFEITEKLIQREYQHLQDSVFTQFYDEFYSKIALNLQKYCSMPVFPIFRFCQHIPLKIASPLFTAESMSRKMKRYNRQYSPTRILSENSSYQVCYMLQGHKNIEKFSFQLVIANNYSKHDQYRAQVQLIQPKIKMGDIAFEQNRKINHTTFLKHYFTSLYKALYIEKDISLLKQNGIKDKSNIVPLYFTGQDYDEQFSLFKGQRYFQLINNSPIDIHFTHYGFQNKEKIRFFSGFTIEQIGVPQNTIVLKGNSKSTFKISFHVDQNFNLNISNQILNKNINFYLYNGNHYYIRLNIVIKIVDNIIIKMKIQSQRNKQESKSTYGYILINLLSLGFICAVITQLKHEEEEKSNKLKIAKEKMNKIENLSQQTAKTTTSERDAYETQLKIHKFNKILSPNSIGSRISINVQKKDQPYACISEEDLAFFKTLKIKEDKNIISDSQSEPQFRLSQHSQSDKLKTDEEEKSQISQSVEEIKNYNEQSNLSKTSNNQQAEEDYEQQEEGSQLEGSQGSITQSFLPDGISVCNDQIDIDDNMQFQFGFEKEKPVKPTQQKGKKSEDQFVYYNVFSSYNPLKKESNDPFPWMAQNEKKKVQRAKHRKQE